MTETERILQAVFPEGVDIQSTAETILRESLVAMRHPATQAGAVTCEDGALELRSGGSPGASLTLHDDGTSTLISPGGLALVGPHYHPGLPSESLRFAYGTLAPNPFWESAQPCSLIDPSVQVMVLLPGAQTPVPVPLSGLFTSAPLLSDPNG